MIKQPAKVVNYDENTIWLEAERQSTCSGCQLKQGCGTGLLDNHVGKRFSDITVEKTSDVSIGQDVTLAIPEETLLQGAALMYILPLVLMFIFAAVAQALHLNEAVEIISGLGGLFVGLYWVRIQLANKSDGFKVKIIEE